MMSEIVGEVLGNTAMSRAAALKAAHGYSAGAVHDQTHVPEKHAEAAVQAVNLIRPLVMNGKLRDARNVARSTARAYLDNHEEPT